MIHKKMVKTPKDKTRIKLIDLLKSHPDGLTIKEMMDKTGLARHTLLARLHHLQGEDKIGVRQINMAKLHRWKHENEEKPEKKSDDVEVTALKEEHIKEKPKEEVSEEEIAWDPELSVGEEHIDEQHQEIILQIQKLEENLHEDNPLPGVRECIHFLDKYIKEHFSYEEKYMKENKYPGLAKHKKIHNEFVKFYNEYKEELALKLAKAVDAKELAREHTEKVHEYLGNWIIEHIGVEDKKYCEFISPDTCGKPVKVAKSSKKKSPVDISQIKAEIDEELRGGKIKKHEAVIKGQREPIKRSIGTMDKKKDTKDYIFTGVEGFDELLETGIPRGSAILVAGGAGSGKTIFSLQALNHHALQGKKCLYMTFEENPDRLVGHMEGFGWDPKTLIKKGLLKIQRFNPFDITRNVDALLAKQKGELLIDVDPVIIPEDFKPDFIALDSLTAIASAFTGKEESYRIYIEQLFRFFEKIGATSLLITETEQIPKIFSQTGVEEFLADGVVVFYNLKNGNVRENALEILKLRGAAHQKKIVAMQITGEGIVVYPEQEVFSEINSE